MGQATLDSHSLHPGSPPSVLLIPLPYATASAVTCCEKPACLSVTRTALTCRPGRTHRARVIYIYTEHKGVKEGGDRPIYAARRKSGYFFRNNRLRGDTPSGYLVVSLVPG